MRKSSQRSFGYALSLVGALIVGIPSNAQGPAPGFEQLVGEPHDLPQLPPQGAWGEVINVTARWIVIQNHSGQQYPIAAADIGGFLMRWPSSIDALGPASVVEAVGRDLGSNMVEVSHVDVFEGADRNLVAPRMNQIMPNNGMMTAIPAPGFTPIVNAWNAFGVGQNQLFGWAYPTGSVFGSIPNLHVVGNVLGRAPLQVSLPGNNLAIVIPADNVQFTITQVTRGTLEAVRKGDFAFMMPQQIKPKGLAVSELVVYKTVPFRKFNERR